MVSILPFETSAGYPQKQLFKLNKITYSAFFQRNITAGIYTILIRRVSDEVLLYSGKLVEGFYNDIKNEITKEVLFTLYVKSLDEMEIWII
ncbi:MAG: hypothetical protein JXQ82_07650 [Methanomicrobiaceae archaeon]|nr:hypothetical protein [Methanomicrobiaceae archaeon]